MLLNLQIVRCQYRLAQLRASSLKLDWNTWCWSDVLDNLMVNVIYCVNLKKSPLNLPAKLVGLPSEKYAIQTRL